MTDYQSSHPASLRPANQPPRSSQPVTPTPRTSAVHDGSGVAAYHQGQEDHYLNKALPKNPPAYDTDPSAGIKGILKNSQYTDNVKSGPKPGRTCGPQYTSANIAANMKATARKPVAQADPKLGPQAPTHKRAVSAEEIGLKPPSMTPTDQVAAGAPQYITTTPDGKFDPRTIQPRSPMGTGPPPSTYAGGVPPPTRGRRDPDQMPSVPTHASESSSNATIRPSLRRQDSSSSINSMTDGLKKMGSRIRRGSNEFFGGVAKVAALAGKSPIQRTAYEKAKAARKHEEARQRSQEREEKCQQNFDLRPQHEREALRQKNFNLFEQKRQQGKVPPDAPNPHHPDASEQVKLSIQTAHIQEQKALYRRAKAAERGQQPTDDSTNDPPEISPLYSLSLSPSEREWARKDALITRPPSDEALDGFEKAGKVVGKLLDPMRRKGSDESEMFGGPTPDGAMDPCNKCGRQPKSNLRKGLCEICR